MVLFKIKSELNKTVVNEVKEKLTNHLDKNLCNYYKDLYKYTNKIDIISVRVDEIVRWIEMNIVRIEIFYLELINWKVRKWKKKFVLKKEKH